MKKYYYLLPALAFMTLVGCQNEKDWMGLEENNPKIEITASFERDAESRTALKGTKVVWDEADKLSVFYRAADAHNKFGLTSGAGETFATFTSEGSFSFGTNIESAANFASVAYYPYNENTTVSKEGENYLINTEIPAVQTYKKGSFGQDAFPMVSVSEHFDFTFKNVPSILKVSLTGNATIKRATLQSKANKLAGNCVVTVPATLIPTLEMADDAVSVITLDCGDGVALNEKAATEFLFAIPPGTYAREDFTVTFYATDNSYYQCVVPQSQDYEFKRSEFLNFNKTYESNGTALSDEEAFLAAIAAGGEVTLDTDINLTSPVVIENTVILNLNGKTISSPATAAGSDEGADAFQVKGNGSLTINGDGNIKATMDCVWAMDNAKVEINGGNFEAACEAVYAKNNAQVVINGGSFKAEGEWGQTYTLNLKDEDRSTASITVKGGTFYKFDPANNTAESDGTNFVAAGYSSVANGDYYEVSEGIKNEAALVAAIAAGGEVTLTDDVTLTAPLNIVNDLTLDLGTYTITGTGLTNDAVVSADGATVTIKGDGTVSTIGAYPLGVKNGGTMNVEGGTFEATNSTQALYVWEGTANVKGGYFNVDSQYNGTSYVDDNGHGRYVLNCLDTPYKNGTAKIIVTGGKFYNFDPANNAAEGAGTNFVSVGYSSVADGENYTVSEGIKNEAALVAAIAAGGEITLADDITLTNMLQINAANTSINLNKKTVTANCQKAFEVYADATIKNGTIVSTQRCVDTRKAVNLTLENVVLEAPTYNSSYGNQQPLTIGGSENGTNVKMNSVTINAGTTGYGIISFVETKLEATNCKVDGYVVLYSKDGSDNSEYVFTGCNLTNDITKNDVAGNSTTLINIEGTQGVKVGVNGGSVTSKGTNTAAVGFREGATNNNVTIKDAEISGNILYADLEGNTVVIPEKYAETATEQGCTYTPNGDGTITIAKAE